MIAPNSNLLCKQAELHYYDFIFKESHEPVPEFIIDHIKQCQNCQEQIKQVGVILSQADDMEPEQGQVSSAITEMLKLHFAYIGKPVTCETIRPFLPTLLDPALEVRIPTPITAHLDNCRQCSEDLETIRRLNISRKQLCRLSQLFAEKPGEDNISCSQAHAAIVAVVFMRLDATNADVLRHLCICPGCQKALYDYRESIRSDLLLNRSDQKEFPCEQVSATDIFDYVVPYGLDPANDQYAKFRESPTSHRCTCPTCLAKMQQLHNTVYELVERAESGVVTIYHIDESAKAKAISESDDLYAGLPVKVEVMGREDEVKAKQPAPAIDFGAALKQKVSAKKLKPFLKTAVAAAAVILIAVALFLNIPTAKAVSIEQIYKALEKIENVYIASFVPDKKEPIQERWVSRTLKVQLIKTEKELVLWDVSNKVRKIRRLDTNLTDTTPLSAEMAFETEKIIAGSLGLVPFDDLSVVPKDAKWSQVTDDNLEAVAEGIEVYDLEWTEKKYGGSAVFKKWRVFINPKTSFPQRTEFYEKLPADTNYNLRSEKVVEYLSNSEMRKVIEEASF